MPHSPRVVGVIAAALAAIVLAGCRRAEPLPAERPVAVQTVGEGGPVRATLTVSPTTLTTAERLTVRLVARVDAGRDLADVDLAKALPEGMSVVDLKTGRRVLEGGTAEVLREWTVEPFLAGEYEIGSVEVRAGDGEPLTTQPVRITVASVIQPGQEDLADAKPVVDPPREWPRWYEWALGVLAVMLAGALIWAWRRRSVRAPEPERIPAHALALRRLAELMSRRLVDAGRYREFYDEASLILRRYIEDRFGLHAPERTTEEFLSEARTSALLMEDDVRVLEKFLSRCDMIKFAAEVPTEREAAGVADVICEFVERTRDEGKLVVLDSPPGVEASA